MEDTDPPLNHLRIAIFMSENEGSLAFQPYRDTAKMIVKSGNLHIRSFCEIVEHSDLQNERKDPEWLCNDRKGSDVTDKAQEYLTQPTLESREIGSTAMPRPRWPWVCAIHIEGDKKHEIFAIRNRNPHGKSRVGREKSGNT